MKKIIVLAVLVVLGSAVGVYAKVAEYAKLNPAGFRGTLTLEKGWNLVGLSVTGKFDSDPSSYPTRAGFFYDPYRNEYIQVFPEEKRNAEKLRIFLERVGDPEKGGEIGEAGALLNSAMWIYSDKMLNLPFVTTDKPFALQYVNIKSGWNFLTVTPEMEGKSLSALGGTCTILKSYMWNEKEQRWDRGHPEGKFRSDLLWKGVVLNVSNDCKLAAPEAPVVPPPLPE